jgi:hypothetical protein
MPRKLVCTPTLCCAKSGAPGDLLTVRISGAEAVISRSLGMAGHRGDQPPQLIGKTPPCPAKPARDKGGATSGLLMHLAIWERTWYRRGSASAC